MIPYRYTYFFGTLLFMIPWILMYCLRKEVRKEMFSMSIFGAVMSIITGFLWLTYDWWRPDTITYTRVGLEDLLLGFGNGGVGAVLYQFVHKTSSKKIGLPKKVQMIYIMLFLMMSMSIYIWVFHWTSFIASTVSMILISIYILNFRRDLFKSAFMSGIYMVILSIPIYIVCEYVSPGWIAHSWYMQKLSGILLLKIPIEDLVFYFQAGLLSPLFYKFWNGVS